MKKIALGTTSQNKRDILVKYLKAFRHEECIIVLCNVSSGIIEQPLNEETTVTGAVNRARGALEIEPDSDYGIGLEAGLVELGDLGYFLVCVCALLENDGTIHLGISGKTPLPTKVSKAIKTGEPFGKSIREYRDACNDNAEKEWADRLISREQEFLDAIERAFFQSEYL